MSLKYRTAVLSLGVQVVTGALTALAFAFPSADADERTDLRVITTLEVSSQVLEFAWYAYIVLVYRDVVTWARYLDWFVSTPLMLTSTTFFLLHRQDRPFGDALNAEGAACLACNAAMLACGYAVESGRLAAAPARALALAAGGVFFVASFALLGTFVVEEDDMATTLYWIMYVVWAAYGGAALLDDVPKNVAYNGLDLVAKNGYGLFLLAYAVERS